MGITREKITLKNVGDLSAIRRGLMPSEGLHQVDVQAVVDTGAITLVIPEETRAALGLSKVSTFPGTLANGLHEVYPIAEPVEVRWKDRFMVCQPIVVPQGQVLLGAIPLENMDLMVDPGSQKLVGVHGDEINLLLC
jgi:hypothetical protein